MAFHTCFREGLRDLKRPIHADLRNYNGLGDGSAKWSHAIYKYKTRFKISVSDAVPDENVLRPEITTEFDANYDLEHPSPGTPESSGKKRTQTARYFLQYNLAGSPEEPTNPGHDWVSMKNKEGINIFIPWSMMNPESYGISKNRNSSPKFGNPEVKWQHLETMGVELRDEYNWSE